MHRRQFLKSLALTTAFSGLHCRYEQPKPINIMIMMADDLGYGDLSCYGSKETDTPNLDKLAKQGIRFTDFYAAAPNCSPSRASMLTGRFPARVGMYSYIPPDGPHYLRAKEITIASLLKQNGYDTAHIGKWHLSYDLLSNELPNPADHGFSYWMATENNAEPSHRDPVNFIRNGEPVDKIKGYSSQIVADEALAWLTERQNPEKPFFLNLWFHEPHRKVAAPPEMVEKHSGQKDAVYFACIENMDNAIGRVLDKIDELGLSENTFILFTSDNGSYRHESNGGLRAAKSWVWEGGIREPAIMRWPGKIDAELVCKTASGLVDLLPTLCEITGTRIPGDRVIDGTSLVPLFSGKPVERKTPLMWYFYRTEPACAMRMGDWSLIGYLDKKVPDGHPLLKTHMDYILYSVPAKFELYNLKKDITQSKDLSTEYPEQLQKMKNKMILLHKEMIVEGGVWEFQKS